MAGIDIDQDIHVALCRGRIARGGPEDREAPNTARPELGGMGLQQFDDSIALHKQNPARTPGPRQASIHDLPVPHVRATYSTVRIIRRASLAPRELLPRFPQSLENAIAKEIWRSADDELAGLGPATWLSHFGKGEQHLGYFKKTLGDMSSGLGILLRNPIAQLRHISYGLVRPDEFHRDRGGGFSPFFPHDRSQAATRR